MDRCDFCSIMTCLKNHISESNQMSQPEFLYEIFADFMDSEVPKPCRHFLGRENELEKLHAILEENSKVFLYGIAGIGKSELAKAYAKTYRKEYTNILYLMYSGNLRQDIIDLDFADDLPEDTEENFRTRSQQINMILTEYYKVRIFPHSQER